MNIYHLEICVYSDQYGKLRERDAYASAVFSTLEKAVAEGKHLIAKRIEQYYNESTYPGEGLTVDQFIADKEVRYEFYVQEIDPEYADNDSHAYSREDFWKYPPSEIDYCYDRNGELTQRMVWYSGLGYEMYLGDALPEAGTHFQCGDFVTVEYPGDPKNSIWDEPKGHVFVVMGCPRKPEALGKPWENYYWLDTVAPDGRYQYSTHDTTHEKDIRKFEGKIPTDHPLQLLRKIAIKEVNISETMMRKLERGEIALNIVPSWRDIPELYNSIEH